MFLTGLILLPYVFLKMSHKNEPIKAFYVTVTCWESGWVNGLHNRACWNLGESFWGFLFGWWTMVRSIWMGEVGARTVGKKKVGRGRN